MARWSWRWLASATAVVGAVMAQALAGVTTAVPASAAGAPGGGTLPMVNWATLEREPIQQWGVVGLGTTTNDPKPQVWDITEIGDRIFVGGTFTGVQLNAFDATPVQPEAYLAAFDRDSGEWISSFRPSFNATVYALEVAPDGSLLVGGEFTEVNGVARSALVALDPMTGATRTTFGTAIGRLGGGAAMVRELVISGGDLYVVGTFNQVVRGGTGYWVYQATRLRASSGELDPTWLPRPVGSGVWDVLVDKSRGWVHLAGYFSSVDAQPSTANLVTVSEATGAVVGGLTPFTPNDPTQTWTRALGLANNRLYTGGAQHMVQVLDAGTRTRIGYDTTGFPCSDFLYSTCALSRVIGGGDFQVIETAGNAVIAGCHCFGPYPDFVATYDNRIHYSSFTGLFTPHRNVIAYDPVTSRPYDWYPGLRANFWGAWALFVDSRQCVYVGGDYNRTAAGLWIGGFGRFCNPVTASAAVSAFSANRNAYISWTATGAQLPVARYDVYRGTTLVGSTASTSLVDTGATVGSGVQYRVETVDASGRRSVAVPAPTVTIRGTDIVVPGAPPAVTATVVGGTVALSWTAATDDQAVAGYLVHRNDQFTAWVPAGTTWTDTAPPVGPIVYKVRAQDYAGANSVPTATTATVSADTIAPAQPPGLTGAVSGTSITLTWAAATDNVGVRGYLVHRDFQFVAWVPAGTTYVDTTAAAGQHFYQVRAQDAAGNNSSPAGVTLTR